MEDRYLREKAFHDHAFQQDTRQSVEKYYSLAGKREAWYDTCLRRYFTNGWALEYGCGQGSHAFILAQNNMKVSAIDISDTAIDQAKVEALAQNLTSINFAKMNAEWLAFEDRSFDLVCGRGILHHLDLHRAYHEVARVLTPEGAALFSEPLGHNPAINLFRRLTPGLRTPDEHPLRIDDLVLAREYFSTIQIWYFDLLTLLAVPFRKFRFYDRLLRVLGIGDHLLFRLVPPLKRHSWYCVMLLRDPRRLH